MATDLGNLGEVVARKKAVVMIDGGDAGCELCFGVLVNVESNERLCKFASKGVGEWVRATFGK